MHCPWSQINELREQDERAKAMGLRQENLKDDWELVWGFTWNEVVIALIQPMAWIGCRDGLVLAKVMEWVNLPVDWQREGSWLR